MDLLYLNEKLLAKWNMLKVYSTDCSLSTVTESPIRLATLRGDLTSTTVLVDERKSIRTSE